MSLLEELSLFLGLQIYQLKDCIFISQDKYIREMLKRFNMEEWKPMCTLMITSYKLRKEDESNEVDKNSINQWLEVWCKWKPQYLI